MSEKRKFQVGDVVVLKSGGPLMTVAQNMDGDAVRTIWFQGRHPDWGQLVNGGQGVFNEAVLDPGPGVVKVTKAPKIKAEPATE